MNNLKFLKSYTFYSINFAEFGHSAKYLSENYLFDSSANNTLRKEVNLVKTGEIE